MNCIHSCVKESVISILVKCNRIKSSSVSEPFSCMQWLESRWLFMDVFGSVLHTNRSRHWHSYTGKLKSRTRLEIVTWLLLDSIAILVNFSVALTHRDDGSRCVCVALVYKDGYRCSKRYKSCIKDEWKQMAFNVWLGDIRFQGMERGMRECACGQVWGQ